VAEIDEHAGTIKEAPARADRAGVTQPGWYDDGVTPKAERWYDDGVTPKAERWYDGVAWTEHVRAVPAPFMPPAQHAAPWGSAIPQVAQPWSAPPWDAPPWAGASAPPWAGSSAPPWAGSSAPPARMGADPSDPAHWILPVGRSWQSITAGYLGLLGLVIWVLAPFALWLGIWAMRIPGGHGRGRAVFAIITGALGVAFGAVAVLSWM
jgi:hypothetical protein